MSQDTKKTAAAKAAEDKAKAAAEVKTDAATESEAANAQDKSAQEQKATLKAAQEQKATLKAAQENTKEQSPKKVSAPDDSGLNFPSQAVSAWVGEKRIASWQSAALLRAQGWADDKLVTEDEFNKALAAAMGRAQGGANGRRN